jgi:glycosyltransferase involved in cell wall biosynthesis
VRPRRLAIVATHPIQYYAPLFRRLAERGELDIHVFYGWAGLTETSWDHGFARDVKWDVPLLTGYPFTIVPNVSRKPGTHHWRGIASHELVPAVERWQPDAVLVIGWAFQSHLTAMRAFHGRIPVLFRGDSTLLGETRGLKKWLRRRWLTSVYRNVDLALYVGTHNRRYFRAHGLRDDQLAWVPHAVDNARFADRNGAFAREAAAWQVQIGIPAEAPTALFVGKLENKKAPDLLLSSFLRHVGKHAHLVFVGSGPLEVELRRAASGRSNVHFLGFQNQSRMPVAYRMGHVCVLPSRGETETWGLAVNEAMACGLPVMVSDRVGCGPDLVQPEKTGIIFPSEDGDALGRGLQRLLGDAQLRGAMGAAGRDLIESWSIDTAAERTESAVASFFSRREAALAHIEPVTGSDAVHTR